MNDNFNDQKDILISIKKEISLLHQQVDYLIRNEKPLELLDLDVMMNRTHTLYDLMCSVDLGVAPEEVEDQDEELPVEPEVLRAMFGVEEEAEDQEAEEQETEEQETGEQVASRRDALSVAPEEPVEETSRRDVLSVAPESPVEPSVEEPEDDEDAYFEEELKDFPAEEPIEEAFQEEVSSVAPESSVEPPVEEAEDDEDAYFEEEPEDFPAEEPLEEIPQEDAPSVAPESPIEEASLEDALSEPSVEERVARDDFGFILNFEPLDTPVETPHVETPSEMLDETPVETPSVFTTGDEIEMTIPHIETPDNDYEIETLGDKLQQEHNPTVADKLQHSAVSSLRSSIGINDKFLFVNELFNGSMEKYNRSIENLDDLKTLNGALIYLNELRVELQWNSSNEAYKKLLELVHRKFEA